MEGGQIGRLINLKGTYFVIQAQSTSASYRCELQRCLSGDSRWNPCSGHLEQRSQAGLIQHVHPIVACDRIGAEANRDPSFDKIGKRCYTMAKLGIGRWAMRDSRPIPNDCTYIVRIDSDGMN
jgi:hypothetical protein